MKKLFYILLCTVIVCSCKSNAKQVTKSSIVSSSTDTMSQDSVNKFKSIIKGVWVKNDYINDIIKTKSPYTSYSKLSGVASIIIATNIISNDSTVVGMSLNNHEGTNFTIYFKHGSKPLTLKTNWKDYDHPENFFELGYTLGNSDTTLILFHYNKSKKVLDSTKYTRVLQNTKDDDAAYGINFITNKLLISGKYKCIDSVGKISEIKFSNEGNVSGLEGINTFYVNTDFMAGPGNNIDELSFDTNTKSQKDYGYKINADTLNLYDIHPNADSTLDVLGKMKFKLIKMK